MALRSKKRKRPDYTRAPRPKYRTNDYIRAPKLRVVDSEGALVGVISRDEALAKAKELGVDLVEISPKADPPVAKLIDYGKMLYMLKKKEHQAKKAGKALEQKGVRLTFRMGEGDMERQRQHAQEFLEKGHPLKIQLVMRGRENAHKDLAVDKMKGFITSLAEYGKPEQEPRPAGYQIITVMKPVKQT